jgi:hypothetical protein
LPAENHITVRIDAMNLKDRLCDIETDRRNRLHELAPPNRGCSNSARLDGTLVPVEEPSTASKPDSCTAAKRRHYLITSSAMASSDGGTTGPSALAVLRFTSHLEFCRHLNG